MNLQMIASLALLLSFSSNAYCMDPSESVPNNKLVAEFHIDAGAGPNPRVYSDARLYRRIKYGNLEFLEDLQISASDRILFSVANKFVQVNPLDSSSNSTLPYIDGGLYNAELHRKDGTILKSTVRMPSLIPIQPEQAPFVVKKNQVQEVSWGTLPFAGSLGFSFEVPSNCRGLGHVRELPDFSGFRFESDFAANCRSDVELEFLLGNSWNGDGYGHFVASTNARVKVRFVD